MTYKTNRKSSKGNRVSKISTTKTINGFSLIELMIVLIISSIALGGLAGIYNEFMRTHRRQQRTTLIEHSLSATSIALRDSLTSLPGRGLATSNGTLYDIPLLPFAGSIQIGATNKPIRLGIVTPYKINANDAFTVVYSDSTIPRLPIELVSGQTSTTKVIRVPLPADNSNQFGLGLVGKENKGTKGDLGNGDNPNPDPSSNNPSSGIPNPEMFEIGQLMLLIDSPNFSDTSSQTQQAVATLVTLTSVTKTSIKNRQFLQFIVEVCQNNSCGTLTNAPGVIGSVSSISNGAILAPINLVTYYLKKDSFGNKVIRNDGGVVLPNGSGDGEFSINGGKETIVGETDSLTVSYRLVDGSVVVTPSNPIVPWLNNVLSVDVVITGSMAGTQGTEYFDRSAKINFPVVSRNLE